MTRTRPRGAARYRVVTVVAALAVAAGAASPLLSGAGSSAKDRIAADPPPALFTDSDTAPLGQQVADQAPEAQRLMAGWWAHHDTGQHDAAFTRWLEEALPPPPAKDERAAELRAVQALAPQRTATGVSAATWLEVHGKKDLWKLYGHDLGETLPAKDAKATKKDVKDLLSMAKAVANALDERDRQSAPYVLDPSLRTDKQVSAGQVCPCSYPSSHAADGAAARTYLSALAPSRAQQYRWTEDQVAYSRVYMAGHVPSDITAGSLLGDMIGEYFLVTRTNAPPPGTGASS
jgi:PAP2 superfamily